MGEVLLISRECAGGFCLFCENLCRFYSAKQCISVNDISFFFLSLSTSPCPDKDVYSYLEGARDNPPVRHLCPGLSHPYAPAIWGMRGEHPATGDPCRIFRSFLMALLLLFSADRGSKLQRCSLDLMNSH